MSYVLSLERMADFIGLDQDEDAIAASTKRLEPYQDKVTIVRSNYSDMVNVLHDLGVKKQTVLLLDLWCFFFFNWTPEKEGFLTGLMHH